MFESLERRYLFSFGLNAMAPPPAAPAEMAYAGQGPELIAPVSTHEAPTYEAPTYEAPTHGKLTLEMPAAQFRPVATYDDVFVEIQVVTLQAPPSGFMAPPADAGRRAVYGALDAGSQELLYETLEAMGRPTFAADRSYLPDDKPLANMLLDRLETGAPLRGAPMAPAEGRPLPALIPFLNDGPHPFGAMSTRSLSVPLGIELQRHPAEAPANSSGIADRNSPLPRLASLEAMDGNIELSEDLGAALNGRQVRPAVALAESFDANSSLLALNDSNAAPPHSDSDVGEAPAAWASLFPLIPDLSPDVEKLGQAFQAVFSDLDELGGDLVSSLADHDRVLWGLGAAGVAYYVSGFRLQRSPVARHASARQELDRLRTSRSSLNFLRLQQR